MEPCAKSDSKAESSSCGNDSIDDDDDSSSYPPRDPDACIVIKRVFLLVKQYLASKETNLVIPSTGLPSACVNFTLIFTPKEGDYATAIQAEFSTTFGST
jgi:hypothetical protein